MNEENRTASPPDQSAIDAPTAPETSPPTAEDPLAAADPDAAESQVAAAAAGVELPRVASETAPLAAAADGPLDSEPLAADSEASDEASHRHRHGEAARVGEEDLIPEGPNIMLAVVCWIAGATSLHEGWVLLGGQLPSAGDLASASFRGYLALGIGMLLFSVEALRWGRKRRSFLWVGVFAAAFVLMALGVIWLAGTADPGRRI